MKRTGFTPYVVTGAALMAIGGSLVALDAHAISRYTSTSMSCPAVKSVVRNEGAVILRWTSGQTGNPRFARFVRSTAFCDPNERAVPASVPSASGSCTVKKCRRCDVERRLGRLGFGC